MNEDETDLSILLQGMGGRIFESMLLGPLLSLPDRKNVEISNEKINKGQEFKK